MQRDGTVRRRLSDVRRSRRRRRQIGPRGLDQASGARMGCVLACADVRARARRVWFVRPQPRSSELRTRVTTSQTFSTPMFCVIAKSRTDNQPNEVVPRRKDQPRRRHRARATSLTETTKLHKDPDRLTVDMDTTTLGPGWLPELCSTLTVATASRSGPAWPQPRLVEVAHGAITLCGAHSSSRESWTAVFAANTP